MLWPPHVPFAFATGAAVAAVIAQATVASAATKARPPVGLPPKRTLMLYLLPPWRPSRRKLDADDNRTANISLDRGKFKTKDNIKPKRMFLGLVPARSGHLALVRSRTAAP